MNELNIDMIHYNELRLGNYINWSGQNFDIKSMHNFKDFGRAFHNGNETYAEFNIVKKNQERIKVTPKDIKPIPLTEWWLTRFDFKYQKCGISGADMWQGMGFWIKTNDEVGASVCLRGDIYKHKYLLLNGFYNKQIHYVHQLQNLYYALTGEELNIKE